MRRGKLVRDSNVHELKGVLDRVSAIGSGLPVYACHLVLEPVSRSTVAQLRLLLYSGRRQYGKTI